MTMHNKNHTQKLKILLKYIEFKYLHYIKHLSTHCNHLLVEINPSDGSESYAKCCICGTIFPNVDNIIAGLSLNVEGTKYDVKERLNSGLQLFVPNDRIEERNEIMKKLNQYHRKINSIKHHINNH